jgi:hypothetical protein
MTIPITANDAGAAAPVPVPVEDMMEVDREGDATNEEMVMMMPEEEEESLCIPITSSATAVEQGLFVEVFADELAQTPSTTIAQVLRDEKADVALWADAALVYMQRKSPRDSLAIIDEANQLYTNDKGKKVRVLAANGIAHLAVQQRNQQQAGAGASEGAFCYVLLHFDVPREPMVHMLSVRSSVSRLLFPTIFVLGQAPRRSGAAPPGWAAGPEPSGRTPTASSRRRARSTRSSP